MPITFKTKTAKTPVPQSPAVGNDTSLPTAADLVASIMPNTKAIKTTVEIPADLYRGMQILVSHAKTSGAEGDRSGQAVLVAALAAYLKSKGV